MHKGRSLAQAQVIRHSSASMTAGCNEQAISRPGLAIMAFGTSITFLNTLWGGENHTSLTPGAPRSSVSPKSIMSEPFLDHIKLTSFYTTKVWIR